MLTMTDKHLLGAVDSRLVVWDLWDDYFYRYDTHERCTAEAKKLIDAGLMELPAIGSGRHCWLTDAGRAALRA